MNTTTERRQFLRSLFRAPVRLGTATGGSRAALHDISLRGALVEVEADWDGRPTLLARELSVLVDLG